MFNKTFDNKYGWVNKQPTDAHGYILPKIIELLPKNHAGLKILDIGCGNGFTAFRLASLGFNVTGMDASEDGIRIAQEEYTWVRFEVASVYHNISSMANNFDVVISSEVIEHLFLPRALVENANTALKPGGMLIITTPYHGYLKNFALSIFNKWDLHHTVDWEGGHIKFFSEKTLADLLNVSGFINISFHNVGRIPWLWKSMVCQCFKP